MCGTSSSISTFPVTLCCLTEKNQTDQKVGLENSIKMVGIPHAPIVVLAPGSAHSRPSSQSSQRRQNFYQRTLKLRGGPRYVHGVGHINKLPSVHIVNRVLSESNRM
jgi:hypothetical protein